MTKNDLHAFKQEVLEVLREQAHDTLKNTGKGWVVEAVERTVPVAVEATFVKLGIDCKNPFEAQKDFAHLRMIRTESEDTRKNIRQSVIKWTTTICLSAIGAGFTVWALIKPILTQAPK
jgi:hypothetical protein